MAARSSSSSPMAASRGEEPRGSPRHRAVRPGRRRAGVALGGRPGDDSSPSSRRHLDDIALVQEGETRSAAAARGWGTHRLESRDIVTLGAGGVDRHVARAHPAVGRARRARARAGGLWPSGTEPADRCQSLLLASSIRQFPGARVGSREERSRLRALGAASASRRWRRRVCTTSPIRMPTASASPTGRAGVDPATSPALPSCAAGLHASASRVSSACGRSPVRSSPRPVRWGMLHTDCATRCRSDSVRRRARGRRVARHWAGWRRRAARASPAVRAQGGDQARRRQALWAAGLRECVPLRMWLGGRGLAQRVRGLPCRHESCSPMRCWRGGGCW